MGPNFVNTMEYNCKTLTVDFFYTNTNAYTNHYANTVISRKRLIYEQAQFINPFSRWGNWRNKLRRYRNMLLKVIHATVKMPFTNVLEQNSLSPKLRFDVAPIKLETVSYEHLRLEEIVSNVYDIDL